MADWNHQVADYLLRLESAIENLDDSIQQIRQLTQKGQYAEIENAASELNACLQRLDQLIADRQSLLDDEQAPAGHRTLRSALTAPLREGIGSGRRDAKILLDQCVELGGRMEGLREHAIALFVCQYHLSETADQFLRLMFPQADATAGRSMGPQSRRGGRLLDQAG